MKVREFFALLDAAADGGHEVVIPGVGRRAGAKYAVGYGMSDSMWWQYRHDLLHDEWLVWDFEEAEWMKPPPDFMDDEFVDLRPKGYNE